MKPAAAADTKTAKLRLSVNSATVRRLRLKEMGLNDF